MKIEIECTLTFEISDLDNQDFNELALGFPKFKDPQLLSTRKNKYEESKFLDWDVKKIKKL